MLIILAQVLIKYALLEPLKADYNFTTTLSTFEFVLLVFATVCIAAAGYIINDIEDLIADKINKPNRVIVGKFISEKNANNLFLGLNFIGVVSGFVLAQFIERPSFFVLFIIASALLYMYATFLKKITLVGNIVVALLVGLSFFLVGIFELIPVMTYENKAYQIFFLDLIRDYAIFAFMINLVRELVKDLEDVDGDYKIGVQSLPIVIGRDKATKVEFAVSLIPLMVIIFYLTRNLYTQPLAIGYVLLFIIAPLLYCSIKLFSAETKAHYKHVSTVLKLVMLTGVLSLLLYQFILLK